MAEQGTLLDQVLTKRGLQGEALSRFMDPSLRVLHDPSLIPDMDKAATRILKAITDQSPIAIYGDYDVDGITASAILYHTIKTISPDTEPVLYLPHRLDEGYGLNSEALEQLHSQGVGVVVSVDCGVTAFEPASRARELAMDLIITDHHNPPETIEDLPNAFAVVHPRRPDSDYPFGELCGAGVAYKLAWRLCTMASGSSRVTSEQRSLLIELLSLASLGVIADVVPLLDENRAIARFGLARIKHTVFPGLAALIKASGLHGDEIDSEAVGFRLAPRLNACGRLGRATEALELLTTATGVRAKQIAEELTQLNDERRKIEQAIVKQAIEMAEAQAMTGDGCRAIVLAHEDWHPGVVGIVCSRLVDRFCKPTILMQLSDGKCHGSGRSIEGFNLHAGIKACEEHLTSFGGHDMAAGLSMPAEHFEAFSADFMEVAKQRLDPEDLVRRTKIDIDVTLEQLSIRNVELLGKLHPCGCENPSAILRLREVRIVSPPVSFGKFGKHLKLHVTDGTQQLTLVCWGWSEHEDKIHAGDVIEAVIRPKVSHWNGRSSVEPVLVDLRVM